MKPVHLAFIAALGLSAAVFAMPTQKQEEIACPVAKVAQTTDKKSCCAEKPVVAQVKEDKKDCCATEAKVVEAKAPEQKACCASKDAAKPVVQAVAHDDHHQGACCLSTEELHVAKGGAGCCNEKGQPAKFKVWSEGKYYFYGCEGSASKGRLSLIENGAFHVGKVQPVVGKRNIA